jgi:hypothetical protein
MMNPRRSYPIFLLLFAIFATRCAEFPGTGVELKPTPGEIEPTHTFPPQIPSPSQAQVKITPEQGSSIDLPESDQVIFTITNSEAWSGKEGEPRPDWKGWGAETFTAAPDGTFWIADTAVFPNRLLHYSPQGQLLNEISLEGHLIYAYDLLASEDSLWVLDISAGQPKVVRLNLDGDFLSAFEIDLEVLLNEGEFISPGLFNLLLGEQRQLLASGISGYLEILNADGEIANRPLDALSFYGHTYGEGVYDQNTGRLPIFVDGIEFEGSPDFYVEAEPFLGFKPDGSFALAGYVVEPEYQLDRQVRYYDDRGNLLGLARQHPQTFYKDWNHHLAFGPDSSVYQLLSNPDHSVQVVRLGFVEELLPQQSPVLPTPTHLVPLELAEPAVTDEEQARNTLITFFSRLSSGDYAAAAQLFGGQMEDYLRARLPGETEAEYWEYVCNSLWCLPVTAVSEVEQVSQDEYLFYTVFLHPGGKRFEIGACCGGDPAATPPVWQFAYPVKKIDGAWKVMRPPLFTP